MKLSRYHVVTPPIIEKRGETPKRIVFATRTAKTCIIEEPTWQMLESQTLDDLPPEAVADFARIELLVPLDDDELATVLSRNNAAAKNNTNLVLVIQPTAFCQLGCDYCGQEHTFKWLNSKHQDNFIERARSKLALKQFRHLEIGWFGAEPLSGISVIRALTPRLKDLAKEFNCTYGASIITNGMALTDKVATELVKEHAVRSINVTIDGTAEFHDTRRYKKNGEATFGQIFSNVVNLSRRKDLDVEIHIRTNVDYRNVEGVSPLIKRLAEAGIQDRIKYYLAPIHSWGNDAHNLSLSPQEFSEREIEWFAEMVQSGFSIGLIPTLKPVVCIAIMPHTDIIDASGTLYNCTEVSYVPAYGTPNKFSIGHVSTGEIPGKRNLLGNFNDRLARGEYPCSSCRILPVCGGACPKSWLEGNEPCPSIKYNIEERLVLSYALSCIANSEHTGKVIHSHI